MINGAELYIQGVEKSFVHAGIHVEILKKTTVLFQQGMSYAIMGASGVGKSTLMHILSGLEEPTGGNILFNGHNISEFTTYEKFIFLNRSIGLVF